MSQLVLLGAGHAHLPILHAIPELMARGHRVAVVSRSPYQYYSGMGPGLLSGEYLASEVRFPVREITESGGGTFLVGRAVRIDPGSRRIVLEDGSSVAYDVLSVSTGSSVAPTYHEGQAPDAARGPTLVAVKPIDNLERVRNLVLHSDSSRPFHALVIGGGPAAVEAAAALKRLLSDAEYPNGTVTVVSGRNLLHGFGARAARIVRTALMQLGVSIHEGEHVTRITPDGALLGGHEQPADLVLAATGVVPSRLFADSSLPTGPDGSLAVNEYLQTLSHPDIFGAGDCIWFTPRPLPKAGVFAVREAGVLLHNVSVALDADLDAGGARLRRFVPVKNYLLLMSLSDGTALFWRRVAGLPLVFRSHRAWHLKDRIDRGFMRRFGSEAARAQGDTNGDEH